MEDRIFDRQISKHTMFLNVIDQASLMHRVSSDDIQAFFTLPQIETVSTDQHALDKPRVLRSSTSDKREVSILPLSNRNLWSFCRKPDTSLCLGCRAGGHPCRGSRTTLDLRRQSLRISHGGGHSLVTHRRSRCVHRV
jgi:hypothetical protein